MRKIEWWFIDLTYLTLRLIVESNTHDKIIIFDGIDAYTQPNDQDNSMDLINLIKYR